MVSGQQRVMVDTLLVSGHEDQCDVTVTLDAYWLVRSEGGNEGREGGRESKEKRDHPHRPTLTNITLTNTEYFTDQQRPSLTNTDHFTVRHRPTLTNITLTNTDHSTDQYKPTLTIPLTNTDQHNTH
ncbi:hypothetical protein Pcinc_005927 [Petrolisthes cinctipes]|uniref:Uncharacterized protein n=1 Tax=Petrolisthes cinctipes TaxID=88211 RepID=A0AAE1KYK2_PETCI|nr:hypothetical protein Pcinc_005927 [Petrolisthes cinctipes]